MNESQVGGLGRSSVSTTLNPSWRRLDRQRYDRIEPGGFVAVAAATAAVGAALSGRARRPLGVRPRRFLFGQCRGGRLSASSRSPLPTASRARTASSRSRGRSSSAPATAASAAPRAASGPRRGLLRRGTERRGVAGRAEPGRQSLCAGGPPPRGGVLPRGRTAAGAGNFSPGAAGSAGAPARGAAARDSARGAGAWPR